MKLFLFTIRIFAWIVFSSTTTAFKIPCQQSIQRSQQQQIKRSQLCNPYMIKHKSEGNWNSFNKYHCINTHDNNLQFITPQSVLFLSLGKEWYNDGDDDDDDDDYNDSEIDLSNEDWRAFRAKLVMQPTQSISSSELSSNEESASVLSDENIIEDLDGIGAAQFQPEDTSDTMKNKKNEFEFSPLDPSQWAYESGDVIEQGAVILGGVEQDFGFGLRQQYFHKTVMLVLGHNENEFTKGIILNRPTDMILVDEDEFNDDKTRKWRVWYGGDVQGWDSLMPDIVCLHSLEGKEVDLVSTQVIKGIQVRARFIIIICFHRSCS